MDGIHDLGGKHGHGRVEREVNEPVFHARWEAKVFAIMVASSMAGAWRNTDRFRHLIERINPIAYLSHGYYGRWLGGVETGLVEANLIDQDKLQEKYLELGGDKNDLVAARPSQNPDPQADPPSVPGSQRPVSTAKFITGDRVRTSSEVKPGHTRLPAYARGKIGEVITLHDGWVFPDTNAHGSGEQPQNLYTVAFSGEELWGGTPDNTRIYLDLFEPYLEPIHHE